MRLFQLIKSLQMLVQLIKLQILVQLIKSLQILNHVRNLDEKINKISLALFPFLIKY